jgi:signal transduction histidine kinase
MSVVEAETPNPKFKWSLTAEDIAWIVLFAVLALCQEDIDYNATLMLICLAAFQVLEPKFAFFHTSKGNIAGPLIKIVLCYLLVGWAHGINTGYYPIFLLPIIAAATVLDLGGTIFFIVLACLAYSSFLLYLDWRQVYLPPEQIRLLCLRIFFFPVVGLAVYQQARGKRQEMARTKAAADQLAESNRSLRKAQVSLRRSERLAALGQLTAGLAHELRNPLGTIKASSELLAKPATQQKQELVQELAGYITSEVDRTNTLVSRFLDFARPLQLNATRGDLRDVVKDSVSQTRARAEAKNVHVSALSPENPLEASFDPPLLALAVTNLLQNAIDATQEGGVVEVALNDLGAEILISVRDHGSGIAAEHLESIFNPFFTTKANGTGLGLPLVSKIVDEHQGKLTVRSDPATGTQFDITLPHTIES